VVGCGVGLALLAAGVVCGVSFVFGRRYFTTARVGQCQKAFRGGRPSGAFLVSGGWTLGLVGLFLVFMGGLLVVLVLLARWFPAAFATAGSMLALIFIFIDPCAGRHSLFLLRQKK
jgi:hypothetical protein